MLEAIETTVLGTSWSEIVNTLSPRFLLGQAKVFPPLNAHPCAETA